MARRVAVRAVFGLWLAATAFAAFAGITVPAHGATASHCRADVFEDAHYTICTFDLTASDVRVFWRKADGAPYRTFGGLAQDLSARGVSLAFAINGRARSREDWQEHASVLAAVIAGDSELAALLANRHVHNAAAAFAAATEDKDQAAD